MYEAPDPMPICPLQIPYDLAWRHNPYSRRELSAAYHTRQRWLLTLFS